MPANFPHPIDKLFTPAFCVDRNKIARNCERMLKTAQELQVELRPHMKTAKTIESGILMTGGTKRKIVVSTLLEAEFFADAGFDDILYAYPVTPDKFPRCLEVAKKLSEFHLYTDNEIIIDALANYHNPKGWSVFLKVDCGNGRAGIHWENLESGVSAVRKLSNHPNLRFAGLYSHSGNSYKVAPNEVPDVEAVTIDRLSNFAIGLIRATDISCPRLTIGSTPACSHPIADMKKISEIHPGNYVFYDAQQFSLGSCQLDDIACYVATRVIGHYPHRNEFLTDCGFTGLTKQGMGQLPSGCVIFRDEPNLKLLDTTQEIGKVTTVNGDELDWQKYPIGSMLFMYPWHSCATAAMYPQHHVVEDNMVIETWKPCRGW